MIAYCKKQELPLYGLRWEAKEAIEILEETKKSAAKVGLFNAAREISSFKDIFTAKNLTTLASFVSSSVGGAYEKFSEARTNARMTGKMLAHYLANDNPAF